MDLATQIAEAVAAVINGRGWSEPFAALVQLYAEYSLEALAALRCHVGLGPQKSDRINRRGDTKETIAIDVVLQQHLVPPADTADPAAWRQARADVLATLLQQITTYVRQQSLPGLTDVTWDSIETVPGAEAGYVPEHYARAGVATVLRRLTYKTRLRVPR